MNVFDTFTSFALSNLCEGMKSATSRSEGLQRVDGVEFMS